MDFWYRSDDKFIGQRIALGKYEEYETKLLLRQLRPDDVAVDVGANIGYYTILMAKKAKKVYAVEPEEINFEILQKNVTANNLKNVVLIKVAASNKNEQRAMIKDLKNYGNHHLGREKSGGVDCQRLDDILVNEQKISLIKIDTQGWEPAVIGGAENIIKRDSPVLFLEYWPRGMKEAKLDGDKMINFLKTIYKNIWQIDDHLNIFKIIKKDIVVNKKTGYVDLYMNNKIKMIDHLWLLRNINYKNIIKGIMSYGKNNKN